MTRDNYRTVNNITSVLSIQDETMQLTPTLETDSVNGVMALNMGELSLTLMVLISLN